MRNARQRIGVSGIASACVLILAIILVAGLWPFGRPKNDVVWIKNASGIELGGRGIIVSNHPVEVSGPESQGPCTIEIWLRPARTDTSATILGVYTPANLRQFSLRQYHDGLVMEKQIQTGRNRPAIANSYLAGVFQSGEPAFLAVTSNGGYAELFLNGALVMPNRQFALSSRDLAGWMVLGVSAVSNDTWSGQLLGLAVYREKLSAEEIHADWTRRGLPKIGTNNRRPVALFTFDEGRGSVVHNRAFGGADLEIPSRFRILCKPMLERPWDEFRPTWEFAKDVGVNIIGFIPLGFVFFWLLSSLKVPSAAVVTVVIGLATSLTIELIQTYLPTRDSGMTDLLTNSFGTFLGVLVYRTGVLRKLLRVEGQPSSALP